MRAPSRLTCTLSLSLFVLACTEAEDGPSEDATTLAMSTQTGSTSTGSETSSETSSETTSPGTNPGTSDSANTTGEPDPGDPLLVTLTLSTNSATLGDTLTVSWTTDNAVGCTTEGGTAAWQDYEPALSGGSVDLVLDRTGEIEFGLYCLGESDDEAQSKKQVEVVCLPPEVDLGSVESWSDYWGAPFPDLAQAQQEQQLDALEYIAVGFDTGAAQLAGLLETMALSDGIRNVAIHECPGVFMGLDGPSAGNACFERQADGQPLSFSTDGSEPCQLDADRRYYINVTYADIEELGEGPSYCGMDSCQYLISANL